MISLLSTKALNLNVWTLCDILSFNNGKVDFVLFTQNIRVLPFNDFALNMFLTVENMKMFNRD